MPAGPIPPGPNFELDLSDLGVPGVPRWDMDDLATLQQLHGSDFEAVDVSSLQLDPNSGSTPLPEPGGPAGALTALGVMALLAASRRG